MQDEEIDASTDVSALFTMLQTARAAGQGAVVRRVESRMRELAGQNAAPTGRGRPAVAADPGAVARTRGATETG